MDPLDSSTSETISETKLDELCSPAELGKNWNACISYCQLYECCFDDATTCDISKEQCGDHSICAQFFAKQVGLSSSSDDFLPSASTTSTETSDKKYQDDGPSYIQYTAVELAKACNSKQLAQDPSDCKLLCKGSACKLYPYLLLFISVPHNMHLLRFVCHLGCFSSYSSSNCFERQKPFCHDHAICESVFDE